MAFEANKPLTEEELRILERHLAETGRLVIASPKVAAKLRAFVVAAHEVIKDFPVKEVA